jgi:hypothetical protein
VRGDSAIIVTPQDEIRLAEGSYAEAAKKLQLEFKEDPGADRFLLEDSRGIPEAEASKNTPGPVTDKIPEGFQLK